MDRGRRPRRLPKKQLDELEALMESRDPGFDGPLGASIIRLHGFLTSVVSGPPIMPSQWVPVVFRNEETQGWETTRQAKRAMNLLMRFCDEIVTDLTEAYGPYSIILNRISDPPGDVQFVDDWCKGYVVGILRRSEEWQPAMAAPELESAFAPILALGLPDSETPNPFDEPEKYGTMIQALPQSAIDIYGWWRMPRSGAEALQLPPKT